MLSRVIAENIEDVFLRHSVHLLPSVSTLINHFHYVIISSSA